MENIAAKRKVRKECRAVVACCLCIYDLRARAVNDLEGAARQRRLCHGAVLIIGALLGHSQAAYGDVLLAAEVKGAGIAVDGAVRVMKRHVDREGRIAYRRSRLDDRIVTVGDVGETDLAVLVARLGRDPRDGVAVSVAQGEGGPLKRLASVAELCERDRASLQLVRETEARYGFANWISLIIVELYLTRALLQLEGVGRR